MNCKVMYKKEKTRKKETIRTFGQLDMTKKAKDSSVTIDHKTTSCACKTFTIQKNATQDASGELFCAR